MSHYINSLKGIIYGNIWGTAITVIKGDTRSLDYSSCSVTMSQLLCGRARSDWGEDSAGRAVLCRLPHGGFRG